MSGHYYILPREIYIDLYYNVPILLNEGPVNITQRTGCSDDQAAVLSFVECELNNVGQFLRIYNASEKNTVRSLKFTT